MTAPTPATRGDLGFSYELAVDIDTAYAAATDASPGTPSWLQLAFITAVAPTNNKNMADAATYADKGAERMAITGEGWALAFDHQIQRVAVTGLYIAGLQLLVTASKFGQRNRAAKVHVRYYDTQKADYAFEGVAYVSKSRSNTGNKDLAGYNFVLSGDGPLLPIATPVV